MPECCPSMPHVAELLFVAILTMTFSSDILIALDWTAEPFQAWTNEDLSSGISRHVATVSSGTNPKWLSHMASRDLKDPRNNKVAHRT